jgi:zinc protease
MPERTILCGSMLLALATAPLACGTTGGIPDAAALPEPPDIEQRFEGGDAVVAKLSNGLTIIVRPVHTSPVVCVRAYVKAGGIYEGPWLGCGLSHLLEHLVAKGAEHDSGTTHQSRQTASRVTEIGGQSNAYTTLDHTCYYISAAAGKTMDCIDLIADWMARPEITREDFEREHGVVQRELELRMDSPDRAMWYTFGENAFRGHPASVPVIGYPEPLRNVTFDDVMAYHRRMYVPQNMVFVVVGDFDRDEVVQRCRRAFAGFPAGRAPDHSLPDVSRVVGVRAVTRPFKEIEETSGRIAFRTIPLLHEDLYALDVLSFVLSRGASSRLVRQVQREQRLVTSISTSSWTPGWGAGAFSISYQCKPEKVHEVEKAIQNELAKVIADGVTEAELTRAKRQKLAELVFSQQSADSIAAVLGTDYLTTGDVRFSENYVTRIQQVTAGQVQAMAGKYFDFENMTITRLVPKGSFSVRSGEGAKAAHSTSAAFALPNGLRVVLHPSDAVGLVSMAFVTKGGLLLEDETTNGLGSLMTLLTTKGAGDRSAEEIAAFFAEAGGSISGSCGNNTFYWQASVLDDRFDGALEILADVVIRPTFPEAERRIYADIVRSAIVRQKADMMSELFKFFRRKFFTGSPYRMERLGDEEVIERATVKQLAAHHARHVRAQSSVLAIYGRFDPALARKKVESLFAALPKGRANLDIPPPRRVDPSGELYVLPTEKENAGIIVAVPGMRIDNLDDRFAITVLDTIISGYHLPAGWLHGELRGKKLVYVVHAFNMTGLAPGAFVTYAGCEPDKAPLVVNIIERNLRKAATYSPPQKEVSEAVNVILTAELLQNQALSDLAMGAALDELYGFGYDFRKKLERYYRQVTPGEVRRVAGGYLGGSYVVVVTTPRPELFSATARRAEEAAPRAE